MGVFSFFGLVILASAALPTRWGLRFGILLILCILIAKTLLPTPYDPDWGYDLARGGAPWLSIMIFAGIALRAIFDAGAFGPMRVAGKDRLFLSAFDAALMVIFGAWLGCVVFGALGLALQGSGGGLTLHLSLAVVAILGVVTALRLVRDRGTAALAAAGLTVAALALDGGWRYPDLIVAQANRPLHGQPRCLMTGSDLRSPSSRKDLMALTLLKAEEFLPLLFCWFRMTSVFISSAGLFGDAPSSKCRPRPTTPAFAIPWAASCRANERCPDREGFL